MADHSKKQKLKKQNFNFKGQNSYHSHKGKQNEDKEKLKKKAFHEFKKLKRKQPAGLDVQKLYKEMQSDSDDDDPASAKPPQLASPPKKGYSSAGFGVKKEVSRFSKAQWEHQKSAEKKQQKFEEMEKRKREKEAALQKYRVKKRDKFLKLCKRTSKGQPVMKYQMHFLLEKLEQQHRDRTQASGSSS